MAAKIKKRPKFTDAERHKRFVEMAKEVDASEDPKDFERAFRSVVGGAKRPSASQPKSRSR
jgi:hypothetical protein